MINIYNEKNHDKMKIYDFFYNNENKVLYVEFSIDDDLDEFYRIIELEYLDIEFYSPEYITSRTLKKQLNKEFIIEVLEEYFKENNLPKKQPL